MSKIAEIFYELHTTLGSLDARFPGEYESQFLEITDSNGSKTNFDPSLIYRIGINDDIVQEKNGPNDDTIQEKKISIVAVFIRSEPPMPFYFEHRKDADAFFDFLQETVFPCPNDEDAED